MNSYPHISINKKHLSHNMHEILTRCTRSHVKVTGIIKGCNGHEEIAKLMLESGCESLGSSRITHLKALKRAAFECDTWLVRTPMISEVNELVKYVDVSLNSEESVLEAIHTACKMHKKNHQVVLMIEMGDLREGIFDQVKLEEMVDKIESQWTTLQLIGVGTNLGCYGSIRPTVEKMHALIEIAEKVERQIGRKLKYISGSATSSLPLIFKDTMPERINHLRLGESLLINKDLPLYHNMKLDTLYEDTMRIKAEIIEIKEKPTYPYGVISVDAFGNTPVYEDRGIRKRAILALGRQDISDHEKLMPMDPEVFIYGSSSDHLIVDITDSKEPYQVGDVMSFDMFYQAMLQAFLNQEMPILFE
ncbi:alanine/ornithine racemase family PLP-dependent enzyme [Fusibacter ferrireducens]|uniref:Alanine/ornithine racemase family PLP-dependent enzyme n=1 Tax=Fusibacter ferrireducens TaxID=2785058 RepID=A0ABR9ZSV8_9FIRM|nr:alanine/ornithine racemase family PLP-dependent enzyme [Fusibacter ferrireducens]MBF4693553.1 alanine/ornithine racemase family PLP-dependent enzyme [Fusibacter ferrireducens]